jgi:hypothetical protein
MADVCIERWAIEPDCEVTIVPSELTGYHISSKRWADDMATSDIYVVTDDDHLILGTNWVKRGLELMQAHPEYGMLAAASIIEHRFMCENDSRMAIELHAIGCPYFIRKGTIRQWPDPEEVPANQVDGALCKIINDMGLKTGILPTLRYNHIGYGYSQVESSHWDAPR